MYKCKDCGQEYDIKPDYCDCGNDVFKEIMPTSASDSKQTQEPAAQGPLPSPAIMQFNQTNIPKSSVNAMSPLKKTENAPKFKVDLASLMIFLLCIVLSVLSLIYIGKDSLEKLAQEENQPRDTKALLTPTANLPSINSIWNSTPPTVTESAVKTVKVEAEPAEQPIVQPVVQQTKPLASVSVKKGQTQIQKPQTTVKPQQIKQTQQAVQTPTKTVKQNTTAVQQTQPKTQTSVQTASKPIQQTATSQVKPAQQPVQTVNAAALKREMDNYKIALGRRLSSGIDYTKIIGDGVCAVSFKLDASGNLINRRFVTKSEDNDSLNNAVYRTMMNHPTYQSPPAGYKNETLTFTVSIYGGRFNVSLN